jgi:hypothetical protein
LQNLVKNCKERYEPRKEPVAQNESETEREKETSPSNLLTPSEIESLRQDKKDALAYAQGKSRHLNRK